MTATQPRFAGTTLHLSVDAGGIATIVFDQPGGPFNTVGQALHFELAHCVEFLRADSAVKALILASGKNDFVVGADIGEFPALFERSEAEIKANGTSINAGFTALSDLPFPIIAAIRGMALGGGLELALCADARVLSETGSLGLPEVSLGLIPGLGGTARLPRLIGTDAAARWITTGRPVKATAAAKAGAADRVVPADQLQWAAQELARDLVESPEVWQAIRLRRRGAVQSQSTDANAMVQDVARKTPTGQPAALRAAELLRDCEAQTLDAALTAEGRTFAAIARTQAAHSLSGAFFSQRRVRKLSVKAAEGADKIETVLVLGAGIMGGGIAWSCAQAGMTVHVRDISQKALDKAMAEVDRLAARDVARGRLDQSRANAVRAAIRPCLDLSTAGAADLVIEAVVEKIEVKRSVLAELEPLLKPDAVIATNTSSLRVCDIAGALQDPGRLVGMHFFNPVPVMPLVEIVRAPDTSARAVALAVRMVLDLRKTPVVVKDCPGFLVNRILTAYITAFCRLVAEGIDFRAIDRAMEDWGWPMGPAFLQDVVGMDTGAQVIKVISAGYPERMAQSHRCVVAEMARAGHLGQKTGAGFYRYERNEAGRLEKRSSDTADDSVARVSHGRKVDMDAEKIVERMMVPMLVEAITALQEGVVGTADELDQTLLLGLGFPAYVGGCLRYADWLGAAKLVEICDRLEPDLGASLQAPETLRKVAAKGGRFYA